MDLKNRPNARARILLDSRSISVDSCSAAAEATEESEAAAPMDQVIKSPETQQVNPNPLEPNHDECIEAAEEVLVLPPDQLVRDLQDRADVRMVSNDAEFIYEDYYFEDAKYCYTRG